MCCVLRVKMVEVQVSAPLVQLRSGKSLSNHGNERENWPRSGKAVARPQDEMHDDPWKYPLEPGWLWLQHFHPARATGSAIEECLLLENVVDSRQGHGDLSNCSRVGL